MKNLLLLIAIMFGTVTLTACEPDTPAERLEEAADDAGDAIGDAADAAGDAVDDGVDAVEDAVDEIDPDS